MKALIFSDNHSAYKNLLEVIKKHLDVDFYIHCGDLCTDKKRFIEDILNIRKDDFNPENIKVVCGNCDYDNNLKQEEQFYLSDFNCLLVHGHQYGVKSSLNILLNKIKNSDYNLIFYGHSHIFNDEKIEDKRFINPGSIWHNNDFTPASYVILEIKNKKLQITRHNI